MPLPYAVYMDSHNKTYGEGDGTGRGNKSASHIIEHECMWWLLGMLTKLLVLDRYLLLLSMLASRSLDASGWIHRTERQTERWKTIPIPKAYWNFGIVWRPNMLWIFREAISATSNYAIWRKPYPYLFLKIQILHWEQSLSKPPKKECVQQDERPRPETC